MMMPCAEKLTSAIKRLAEGCVRCMYSTTHTPSGSDSAVLTDTLALLLHPAAVHATTTNVYTVNGRTSFTHKSQTTTFLPPFIIHRRNCYRDDNDDKDSEKIFKNAWREIRLQFGVSHFVTTTATELTDFGPCFRTTSPSFHLHKTILHELCLSIRATLWLTRQT